MTDARSDASLLFVYGSLMSGLSAADMLANVACLGPARTASSFALVTLNGYPGLVPGASSIHGELYRVPKHLWPRLDGYEGAPRLYRRVPIELADGGRALAYLLTEDYAAAAEPTDAVDWRRGLPGSGRSDPSR